MFSSRFSGRFSSRFCESSTVTCAATPFWALPVLPGLQLDEQFHSVGATQKLEPHLKW